MQRGVAAAMQYLSSLAFVHRALSAHSVLVNSHLVCKVARLGHSPQVRARSQGLSLFRRVLADELGPGVRTTGGVPWGLEEWGPSALHPGAHPEQTSEHTGAAR